MTDRSMTHGTATGETPILPGTDSAGRVWITVRDRWQLTGEPPEPINCERLWAREFRYDGSGRRRYLMRDRDPDTLDVIGDATDGVWTDYDGEWPYSEFTPKNPVPDSANLTAIEPGAFQYNGHTESFGYFHGDHLGTTRLMTDGNGDISRRAVYTAFGERIYSAGGGDPADELAGGDSANELPSIHVGERLYDPATGRFLQRDPAGLTGGANVYHYVHNLPTRRADPSGRLYIGLGAEFVDPAGYTRDFAGLAASLYEHDWADAAVQAGSIYCGTVFGLILPKLSTVSTAISLGGEAAIGMVNSINEIDMMRNSNVPPALLTGGADRLFNDVRANRHIDQAGTRSAWAAARNLLGGY